MNTGNSRGHKFHAGDGISRPPSQFCTFESSAGQIKQLLFLRTFAKSAGAFLGIPVAAAVITQFPLRKLASPSLI